MQKSAPLRTVSLSLLAAIAVAACETRSDVPMGVSARTLSVGDLNGDGVADLLVTSLSESADPNANLESEQLVARLADGSGRFGELIKSPGPRTPERTLLVDLNGDQRLDLVSTNSYGQIETFFGNGNGSFTLGQQVSVCERSQGAAAGQFDADSNSDVAVLCREEGAGYLRILVGSAAGQLSKGRTYDILPDRFVPAKLDVGDLDGNLATDLVITGTYDGQPSIVAHLNDGSGGFHALEPTPTGGSAIKLVDIDADRKLDVIAGGETLSVLRGKGDGTFSAPELLPAPGPISDVAAADIDGDGRVDIAATTADGLDVFFARENGAFERRTFPAGKNPADVAIADFDRNGLKDIATLNRTTPGAVTLLLNASSQ